MELIVGIDGSIPLAAMAAAKAAQETYVTSLETQLDVSGNVFTVTHDASSVDGTSRPMFEVIDRFGIIVGHGDGKESGNVLGTAFAANDPVPTISRSPTAPAGPGTTRSRPPPATCRTRTTRHPDGPAARSMRRTSPRPRPAASVLPVTRIPIALPSPAAGDYFKPMIDGARDGRTAPLESLSVFPSWSELLVGSELGGGYTLSYEADFDQTLDFDGRGRYIHGPVLRRAGGPRHPRRRRLREQRR